MTTLMRNGRDRRSENPFWADAILEREQVVGTDQRITSGPAATVAASRGGKPPSETGRIHGCTRTLRKKVRFVPCTAGAVHTCTAGAVHTWPDSEIRQCLLSGRDPLHSGQSPPPRRTGRREGPLTGADRKRYAQSETYGS